jgi:membrane-associated phospholipid phosphatase
MNVLVARACDVWRRADFADRLYLAYLVGLGVLILLRRHVVPGWPAYLALHLVLIAIVTALVLNARHWETMHAWYPLAMPLLTFQEIARLNFLFFTGWRDHYLLAFEAFLFAEPPTVSFGRLASPLLTEMLDVGYVSYYFLLLIVARVLYKRTDKAPFFGVMAASVLSYMVCYVAFIAFPTEGPAHTLRHLHTVPIAGGPFHALVKWLQHAGVHGNAFPSAHVAGAMVPLIFAWRYAPRLGAWLTPLVVLLCLAAVRDRYHYASDIFAGIPVGAAAACFVLFALARPRWALRLNIHPQVSSDPATPAPQLQLLNARETKPASPTS